MDTYIEKTAYGKIRHRIVFPAHYQVYTINKKLGQIRAKMCDDGDLLWDALGIVYRGQRLPLAGSPIFWIESGEWLFNCDLSDFIGLCDTRLCLEVPFLDRVHY